MKFTVGEKIYQEITENSILCIKIFDEKGNLLYINNGGRKEHGIKEDEDLAHWDWLSTIDAKYHDGVKRVLARALDGERGEFIFKHVPGRSDRRWCDGTFSPLKDESGKIYAVLFYSSDITSLKEAELRARENEELFSGFLGIAPLCIKAFDGSGKLLFINNHGKEEHYLNKMSETEIRSWDFYTSIIPKYHQKVKDAFEAALRGELTKDLIIEHVPGKTSNRWCIGDFFVIKNSDGSIRQTYFVSKDISHEKEAQEAMASRKQELEKMNTLMVNRELKMIELKKHIEELEAKLAKKSDKD